MVLKKSDLYNCHSLKLFHFLKGKGFYYISKGLNEKTNRSYWVFEKTGEFCAALDEWDQVKKTFK